MEETMKKLNLKPAKVWNNFKEKLISYASSQLTNSSFCMIGANLMSRPKFEQISLLKNYSLKGRK